MRLLTPEELAELLAISVHTIYAKTSKRNRNNVKTDLPPYIRVGRHVRFPEPDFKEWLKAQTRYSG